MTQDAGLERARKILRHTFGHQDFRGLQANVVGEMLAGRNALAVLPTGGGKSLCYQIPAMMRPGLGLVVSPLIALMSDQVLALKQAGVAAERLDSTAAPAERERIWGEVEEGRLDLLYVSPEGLMAGAMLQRLSRLPIALVAIDEAHCVSQWGHDFRPEYRALGRLAEAMPQAPRLAVTATADARTREDIRRQLRLEEAAEFVASFARPELRLRAERKEGKTRARVVELARRRADVSGIVYVGSRDGADSLAETLRAEGLNALSYHAGLDKSVRAERLEAFLQADAAVMVATIAFGMDIDKPDVRYVIHADPPASIEAYWQEIGRAGRDGDPADGITLHSASDLAFILRRIETRDLDPEVREVQIRKARQLFSMLSGPGCRAAAVRRYFGEEGVEDCGVCDHCTAPAAAIDATESAQKALAAVHRLGGRYGRGRIVDHLLGRLKDPASSEFNLSTFGVGKELSTAGWRDLIDVLLYEGLLKEDPNDNRPLIGLGDPEEVRKVYRGERRVMVRRELETHDPTTRSGRPRKRNRAQPDALRPEDRPLFEALRAWRRAEAAEQHVPPYVIFSDRSLQDIALMRPDRLEQLALANGVGQSKLERYGAAVLKVVREN